MRSVALWDEIFLVGLGGMRCDVFGKMKYA